MKKIVWSVSILVACGGDGGDDPTDGATPTDEPTPTELTTGPTTEGGCADPTVNPWAGSCVETFFGGCFDPMGECTGSFTFSDGLQLEWANGARVETEIDLSSPLDPVATTELIASDGTLCAVGTSENGSMGCASRTVYVRASDSQELVYCANLQGDLTVTCPDGSELTVTAAESQAASGCEYGASEPCDVTFGGG